MSSRFRPPGHHRSADSFRRHLQSIDPASTCVEQLGGGAGPLGASRLLFGKAAGNRWAIHPMEGWDGSPGGRPGELTLRRWRRFGASGAKLIWGGEAYAVQRDGRANPHQLYFHEADDPERHLALLRDAVLAGHREQGLDPDDLVLGLQLTHSGRYSRPDGPMAPLRAQRNEVLDHRFGTDPGLAPITDLQLDVLGESFLSAARAAAAVGFDFVDVKCCHGYLLHELLAARQRPGSYGGDFAGRTRFVRRILRGIRSDCPRLGLGVRLSAAEIFPHSPAPDDGRGIPGGWAEHRPYRQAFGMDPNDPTGFDLSEPKQFLELLVAHGVEAVNVTLGSPYTCPHLQRPATYPPSDGYLPPEDPLMGVARHLQTVRQLRRALPQLALVGSGYSYLQEWLPHVAEAEVAGGHVDFVGLGRMVLSYPELPLDHLRGRSAARKKICRTFSDCTTAPRHGMVSGCYPLDPLYRERPEWQQLRQLKAAQKTQQKDQATPHEET